jgi:hypothetical protein
MATPSLKGKFVEVNGAGDYTLHYERYGQSEETSGPYLVDMTTGVALVSYDSDRRPEKGTLLVNTFDGESGALIPTSYDAVKKALKTQGMIVKI